MRLSRPSPAMVVATLALVVATTGTAFAAKAALIPGSQIKPHSITAKQLATGAVTHSILANKAVQANNFGAAEPTKYTTSLCPDGSKQVGKACPASTYAQIAGGIGTTRITVPAGGGVLNFFAPIQGSSTATLDVSPKVVMLAPDQPISLARFTVGIVGDPATNWPSTVAVGVIVNGQAPSGGCTILTAPGTKNT
ncbi:MAG TPA: hypothetical protein VFE19_02465, partial [Jatrophihabitantaceae bacterium]|nr:hypothetical protein [Jatrophihabitantaceae bacterium]